MANTFFMAPAVNFLEKTLSGSINDTATTITLNNTTSVKVPSYAVIDRVNSSGTATPNSREVIYFTGISGNDLTGVTRGADGSTARSHNDGAIVEFTPTVGLWNSLTTIVNMGLDGDGYLRAIASPVSISVMHIPTRISASGASVTTSDLTISRYIQASGASAIATDLSVTRYLGASGASGVISDLYTTRYLNASGASLLGFPAVIMWEIKATLSGATTILSTPAPIHRAGQWRYANFITRTVASGVSAIVDINKNGVSIFAAVGRPMIAAGGTFASTASIATKGFDQGDRFTLDYDGTGGTILDIIAMLVGE